MVRVDRALSESRQRFTVGAKLVLAVALAGVPSCTDSSGPETPEATGIWVSPSTVRLTALADTVRLTADVRDQNGQVIAGAAVAWSSSDVSVAAVDDGFVRAVGNGTATVTATSGQASGSAEVGVEQEASVVEVTSPTATTLAAVGDTVRLAAAAVDANGYPVAGAVFAWSSGDEAVATVDSVGLVTAVGNGTATVTAASGRASGSADITVSQEVASLEVVSGGDQRGDIGDTLLDTIVVRVVDAGGSAAESVAVSFTPAPGHGMADPGSALTDAEGLARTVWTLGPTEGEQSLTAAAGSVSVSVSAVAGNPDRATLAALYNAADGPNWADNANWLTNAPLDEWHGVSVDGAGSVTALVLEDNNLTGTIPPELGNFARLETLDLSGNTLDGLIPPELGKLARLQVLWLDDNALHGPVPPELGNLTSLRSLYLHSNELRGPIPQSLTDLWLDEFGYADTRLCVPDDAAFREWLNSIAHHEGTGTQCAPLSERDILVAFYEATSGPNWYNSENWLTGAPLSEWHGVEANGEGKVVALTLRSNLLVGKIPPELGQLTNLERLDLRYNYHLEGPIPPEFFDLPELRDLFLTRTSMGGLPPEIGRLAKLQYLYLNSAGLTGTIPPELGQLTDLEYLYLDDNYLFGEIPAELGNLSNLTLLNLSYCKLTGSIPQELGSLAELRWLYLGDNHLSGEIPAEFGDLRRLRALSLRENQLTGSIPAELGDLGDLVSLNIAGNDLSGSIPASFQGLPNMSYLYLQDNALEGPLPVGIKELTNL